MTVDEASAAYCELWTACVDEETARGDENWQKLLEAEKILIEQGVDVVSVRKGK